MGTTADKLAKLAATKEAIRIAINDKGVEVSTSEPFASFPEKIASIESGGIPKVEITITTNLPNVYFDVSFMNTALQQETIKGLAAGTYEYRIVTSFPVTVKPVTKVSGYGVPNIQTKNVIYDSEFKMDYLAQGVYIQHNDLSLYTEDEWNNAGFTDAGGMGEAGDGFAVVLITSDRILCLSGNSTYGGFSTLRWGDANTLIKDILTTTDAAVALLDFDGRGNTSKIISQQPSSFKDNYIAKDCASKISPHGASGYLASAGETKLILNNYNSIIAPARKVGITAGFSNTSTFLSSTQYDISKFWGIASSSQSIFSKSGNFNIDSNKEFLTLYPFISHADCSRFIIRTNRSDATFTISYTSIFGTTVELTEQLAGTYTLPIDLSKPVTVTASAISGLATPASISKLITDGEIFDLKYNVPDVYIRAIDGAEYTPEEWRDAELANSMADCVVVRSEQASFGISIKTLTTADAKSWGPTDVLVNDIVTTTDSATALLDLDGWGNTQKIIAQLGAGNAPAAEHCASQISKGGLQGYLPSYGEVGIVVANFERANDAFLACGAKHYNDDGIIVSNRIWTSTQNTIAYAWRQYFNTNSTRAGKGNNNAVVAFFKLID